MFVSSLDPLLSNSKPELWLPRRASGPTLEAMMAVTVIRRRIEAVGRWEPDARGRLASAAMELYGERGFDTTTVEEIAARAGLTERTFFRYFADKREVLFGRAHELQEFLVAHVLGAPRSLSPIEVVVTAYMAAGDDIFEARRAFSRARQAIIAANTELQERELIKLATLNAALADALRQRGVGDPAASLAAEAGGSAFKLGFGRWVEDTKGTAMSTFIRESLDALKAVAAGG
jgi:AcrR family transcriptional regulator